MTTKLVTRFYYEDPPEMRHRGRANKRDANEPEIIAALEAVEGVTVVQIPTGKGVPDLLVGVKSIDDLWCTCHDNYLIEVKTEHGKLNTKQRKWFRDWRGQAGVAHTPQEALEIIGACDDLDCKCRRAGL